MSTNQGPRTDYFARAARFPTTGQDGIRRDAELVRWNGSSYAVAARGPMAEMQAEADTRNAEIAARQAKVEGYEAAGLRVVRDIPAGVHPSRYRGAAVKVVDADGETVARADSLDTLPAYEVAEVETAEVEAPAETAPARGSITDEQAAQIMTLIGQDAHMGGWYAGPDTLAGVLAMSRTDAADYIRSMTEEN